MRGAVLVPGVCCGGTAEAGHVLATSAQRRVRVRGAGVEDIFSLRWTYRCTALVAYLIYTPLRLSLSRSADCPIRTVSVYTSLRRSRRPSTAARDGLRTRSGTGGAP